MKSISIFAAAIVLFIGVTSTSLNAQISTKTYGRTKASESSLAPSPETSSGIIISQVYGGGGATSGTPTYTRDYIELHNASGSPKSLGGLFLYYGSATGQFASTSGNAFALPNVVVPAGAFYLISVATAGTVGAALPVTADADTTNITIAAASGKVALVAGLPQNLCGASATPCSLPNFNIIDVVSFGAANNAEGNAPTNGGLALNNTQASVRKNSGCTDTDNNNADFDIITGPIPRNSGSAVVSCRAASNTKTNLDMDGDGRTDYVVVRDTNGPATPGGFADWYTSLNSNNAQYQQQWGIPDTDDFAYADYDGDGKTDIGIWRRAAPSTFYILLSSNNTFYIDQLGLVGDEVTSGDYNGDGKADVAVFRNDPGPANNSFWYYRPSPGAAFLTLTLNGEGSRAEGDYDGDGKTDPAIFSAGAGSAGHLRALLSAGGSLDFDYGQASDLVVAGSDFDGDGKADLCVVRAEGSFFRWDYEPSGTAGTTVVTDTWGLAATDLPTPGDYNGDGKADYAVWRPGTLSEFFVMTPQTRLITSRQWGIGTDFPAATGRVSNSGF